jgi:hypothetical protein
MAFEIEETATLDPMRSFDACRPIILDAKHQKRLPVKPWSGE